MSKEGSLLLCLVRKGTMKSISRKTKEEIMTAIRGIRQEIGHLMKGVSKCRKRIPNKI